MRFDETALSDEVLDALDAMNFSTCTPVQEQAIPIILKGHDLLAVAQTGTGKTAAYLLPIIDELLYNSYPQDRINCLVMVPTRELAMQIDQQLEGFSYYVPVSSIAVYGGTDGKVFSQQQSAMIKGVDIVIATPGRLIAHLQMGKVDLSRTSMLVLDEADRMLDMGFYDDIMQIVGRMPKERQTMLFSATMPKPIEKLAQAVLRDPDKIKLAVSRPADKIRQMACLCDEGQKEAVLIDLLRRPGLGKTIVFAASKLKVKDMAHILRRKGVSVAEMHSDLDQDKREETMRDFKAGRVNVLVATDIVARGIDVDNIELAVNYDVPHQCEDYVHRVGRTARADKDGTSLTLVSPRDRGYFSRIETFLGKTLERYPLPEGMEARSRSPRKENSGKSPENRQKNLAGKKRNRNFAVAKPKQTRPKPAAPGQN